MSRELDSGIASLHRQALRRSARVPVVAEVQLRRTGATNYRVNILDLSIYGCRVEFVERPRLDERVWIKFDQLHALEAVVCWTENFFAGLEFATSIHPAVLQHVLKQFGTPSRSVDASL